jgi:hypothetical protein
MPLCNYAIAYIHIQITAMSSQNYSNHARFVPLFHFVAMPLLLALLIGAGRNVYQAVQAGEGLYSASLILVMVVVLMFVWLFARMFALKAQDRAIRAEENFRHYLLTGKTLDPRLRMSQIIALRFAPDEEFPALTKKAVEEGLSAKAIKQAIQNWKGDYYRV